MSNDEGEMQPAWKDIEDGKVAPPNSLFSRTGPHECEVWYCTTTDTGVAVLRRAWGKASDELIGQSPTLQAAFSAFPALAVIHTEDSIFSSTSLDDLCFQPHEDCFRDGWVEFEFNGESADRDPTDFEPAADFLWSVVASLGGYTASLVGRMMVIEATDMENEVDDVGQVDDVAAFALESFHAPSWPDEPAYLEIESPYFTWQQVRDRIAIDYHREVSFNGEVIAVDHRWLDEPVEQPVSVTDAQAAPAGDGDGEAESGASKKSGKRMFFRPRPGESTADMARRARQAMEESPDKK